jgi:hypothetical protein
LPCALHVGWHEISLSILRTLQCQR